jgi:hypothetical protein
MSLVHESANGVLTVLSSAASDHDLMRLPEVAENVGGLGQMLDAFWVQTRE